FITAAALAGLVSGAAGYGFDVFRPAAIIRFFAITRTAGRYAERLASHNAVLGLLRDLRVGLFSHIARLPMDPRRWRSAQLLQRLVVDIDLLDQFPLRILLPWLWASLLLVGVLVMLALLDTLLLLVGIPLLAAWLLPWLGYRRGSRLAESMVMAEQQHREYLLDSLRLLNDLLIWQRWEQRRLALEQGSARCLDLQWQQRRLSSVLALAQQWLLGLGGTAGARGMSRAAVDRINTTLEATEQPRPVPAEQPGAPWYLQLQGVSARRPGALNGPQQISFEMRGGDVVWIAGASGSGKSTLLDMLATELPLGQGSCLLNGRPLRKWDLRRVLGYLPQQVDLFDLSLAA